MKLWRIEIPGHPTFFLHPDVSGIVRSHEGSRYLAQRIAAEITKVPSPLPAGPHLDRISAELVEVDEI